MLEPKRLHPVTLSPRHQHCNRSPCYREHPHGKTLQCTQSKLQSRSTTHTSLSRSPALQDRLPVYSNFFIECRFPAASSLHKPKSQHTYTNHDITPRHPATTFFFSHYRNEAVERSAHSQLSNRSQAVPSAIVPFLSQTTRHNLADSWNNHLSARFATIAMPYVRNC